MRGRKGGSKPAVTEDKPRGACEHIAMGLTVREAATRIEGWQDGPYHALAVELA